MKCYGPLSQPYIYYQKYSYITLRFPNAIAFQIETFKRRNHKTGVGEYLWPHILENSYKTHYHV